MHYLTFTPGHVLALPAYGALPVTHHVFDADAIEAVNAALAARRPLLVRGEPGTGKSQLARAAAAGLGRAFLPFTVDARTESRDLLYTVDTVARLAEAQILGHLEKEKEQDVRKRLAEARYTTPGPLWWVFQWDGARQQAATVNASEPWTPDDWQAGDGAVLLIDEIDKADPAVPNGLLEALGLGRFPLPDRSEVVVSRTAPAPLVLITTNEERALPDAFVRRCLVLQLGWPKDRDELVAAFVARGEAHHGDLSPEVLRRAAEMVAVDREIIQKRGVCPPGGAEYLDLLRAVSVQWPDDQAAQLAALERVGRFVLRKHPEEPTW